MPIIFQKNDHSHKNNFHIIFFFEFLTKSPLLSCPYLIKKTSIMSKLNYIMAEKSQSDALFFRFFIKKYCPNANINSQKDVHSLTNTLLSYPYFVVKSFILSKTLYSHVIFFQLLYEKPRAVIPYLIKKSQFCQNYIILWIKKVKRMPFFYKFSAKKSPLSCPYFVKKTSILKKTHCSQVHILSKYVQFLKNTALMSFFQNFHEKLSAVKPIFGQKNVNSVKTTNILWAQKDNKMSFFPDLKKKILSCQYFVNKTSIL